MICKNISRDFRDLAVTGVPSSAYVCIAHNVVFFGYHAGKV